MRRALFPLLVIVCLLLVIQVGERYAFRVDVSRTQIHSLSASAANALANLDAPLQITAYVPELRVERAEIDRLLAPYLAHPSGPRLTYVDPLRQPERARQQGVQRRAELHLQSGPRREVVATPSAAAIDLALNRLALRGEQWIVVLRGHGEAALDDSPGGLGRFAGQLERLGYRAVSVDPRQVDEIPDNTAVLLIAGPSEPYDGTIQARIERYLDNGGALLWLLDQAPAELLERRLGIRVLPGIVVDAGAAQHGLDSPDHAIVTDYPEPLLPRPPRAHSVLTHSRGLTWPAVDDWQRIAHLSSGPRSWNETGDLKGRIARQPAAGERAGPIDVLYAFRPSDPTAAQRLVVAGSRHFIANGQIGRAGNAELAIGLVRWLTTQQALSAPLPAADLEIRWSPRFGAALAIALMAPAPLALLATGLWLRSRRRRA